jgi:hypothetical protein
MCRWFSVDWFFICTCVNIIWVIFYWIVWFLYVLIYWSIFVFICLGWVIYSFSEWFYWFCMDVIKYMCGEFVLVNIWISCSMHLNVDFFIQNARIFNDFFFINMVGIFWVYIYIYLNIYIVGRFLSKDWPIGRSLNMSYQLDVNFFLFFLIFFLWFRFNPKVRQSLNESCSSKVE